MGLSISPQVWITYIENLLKGISNRDSYIAIMDDLMLHGFKGQSHGFVQELVGITHSTWIETVPLGNVSFS